MVAPLAQSNNNRVGSINSNPGSNYLNKNGSYKRRVIVN
jgi:hypothetical protein